MIEIDWSKAPNIGEYWPGQGGINGGLVAARGDVPAHYLIFAAKDAGSFEWGPRNTDLPGTSKTDGKLNTELMCFDENDYPAANACAEYTADGHNDFYLPAAAELYQGWLNCPEAFAQDAWYWSSSQRSAYYAFSMYFDDGDQGSYVKHYELRVRPVRRLFIYSFKHSDIEKWKGEGLPPVGTVCEVFGCEHEYTMRFNFQHVQIIAHHTDSECDRVAVFAADDLEYHGLTAERFRPLRTPEQIAAEERLNAIEFMHDLVGDIEKIPTWTDALAKLYDAGLRFPSNKPTDQESDQ